MCEVGKTTSVCYTNTSTENGGSYYWGDTQQTNRKWKVYKAVPQYQQIMINISYLSRSGVYPERL